MADPSVASGTGAGPSQVPSDAPPVVAGSSEPASTVSSCPKNRVTPANRPLRTRTSLPAPPTRSSAAPPKDLDKIKEKLTPSAISLRKDELVKEKEESLRELVDGHDTAVREKFHLERYISLLEGYDPVHIKQEQSPVFLDYKRQYHNLLDHIPQVGPVAGPSRTRGTVPSRTTRRQAHERSELFATPVAASVPTTPAFARGKGKATAEPTPEAAKGKGKGRAAVSVKDEPSDRRSRSRSSIAASPAVEMPPPPIPPKKGKARRATLAAVDTEPESETDIPEADAIGAAKNNGKKRGRMSLPNLPTKKRKGQLDVESDHASPSIDSPAAETPAPEPEPTPVPAAEPEPLPSLAHIPFPPPPLRPKERNYGPKRFWYTDPRQKPAQAPKHDGRLQPVLDAYIHIEDTGPPADPNALHIRALNEAYYRNRVNYLQHQGRLSRLLEDDTVASSSKTKLPALPARQVDFRDSLMSHMVQVRTAMMNESKSKPVVCKRIARMVLAYWEHVEGKEERERLAEERDRKKKAKDLVRAVRKRWALAVKIVRARMLEAQKAEQDRLGKEHLQNMLQRSTGLLDAQRDDLLGQGRDDNHDDDDEGNDSDGSSGTEDVSEADDSDEDGEMGEATDEEEDGKQVAADEGDEENPDEHEEDEGAGSATSHSEGEEDVDGDEGEGDSQIGIAALLIKEDALEKAPLPNGSKDINDSRPNSTPSEVGITAPAEPLDSASTADPEAPLEIAIADPVPISTEALVDAVASLPDNPTGEQGRSPGHNAMLPDATSTPLGLDDHPESAAPQGSTLPPSKVDLATNHVEGASVTENMTTRVNTSASYTNGHSTSPSPLAKLGVEVDDEVPPTSSPRRSRSRRSRASRSVSLTASGEDPDANDVEFEDKNVELSDEDHNLDVEMEEDQDESGNSEDEGLLADADLPIEELMKRYGYPIPGEEVNGQTPNGKVDAPSDVQPDSVVVTDKSLLDESLQYPSANLIIEGKRNRRVRSVWTPEDNPPPPPKKPKIEVVDAEEESDREMTPELSSEGETGDEEEEIGEVEDANKVRPPFLLRGTLRPYQQAGLEWLASLYANRMNGILADEMGLGKTIQTISLLGHLACDKGVWGQHLIIVPTSVILNWEMEFKKFLPGLKVLTYYGNQKERKEKRKGWHTENTWQVCITSYQIVLADQHIFRRKNWVYMILDEAHNIKNFRSQRWQTLLGFKASRRLLLTGTPLQNNLMELWSLLYFLMPNGVTADATAVVGFANHKEFSEWFSNPMDKAVESGDTMDEETMETVSKLHTLLRPFILRRLKSEVETQLPGKFEHVVYCKLSKRQRFLYDEFMSRASTKEALVSGGYLGVVNTLMQLRKVCNHPDLFEVRPVKTSFAMERSVLGDFEPSELLVRKRLLARQDELGFEALNLIVRNENQSAWACRSRRELDASALLPHAVEVVQKGRKLQPPKLDTRSIEGWMAYKRHVEEQHSIARWRSIRDINQLRCAAAPTYGSTLLELLGNLPNKLLPGDLATRTRTEMIDNFIPPAAPLISSYADRAKQVGRLIDYYAVQPPNAVARDLPQYALPGLTPTSHPDLTSPDFDTLHPATVKLQIAFPDVSLLQYDCGKLQKLAEMMRELKPAGHRVLIFTQMTRVLDILEMFLSYNGHRYLRLDGSTKIEDRQIITERFNSDSRIFCFIASSRSGGVGINLTGADTVFFYDSDWNPSMDRQCMDRAHRIGQTREVHIYRFVSIHTVEENMLKKANQKRLLDKVIIQEGDFTTDFFGKMDWRDIIDTEGIVPGKTGADADGDEDERVEDVQVEDEPEAIDVEATQPRAGEERELARAFAEVEDEEDAAAARIAQGEGELDFDEFVEGKKAPALAKRGVSFIAEGTGTPMEVEDGAHTVAVTPVVAGEAGEEEEDEDDVGAVDEYMLKWVEEDWDWFVNY